jgi:hypothetical protein
MERVRVAGVENRDRKTAEGWGEEMKQMGNGKGIM